jgi:hypothetical protein
MMSVRTSESVTENIFRDFHRDTPFIEKSAISDSYGFVSKRGTGARGYPDFLREEEDFVIIVEAKALKQSEAEEEVCMYMDENNIEKDIVGIAVSGQNLNQIKVTYFYKLSDSDEIEKMEVKDRLLPIDGIKRTLDHKKRGETVTEEELILTLKNLNQRFQDDKPVRSTDRSLFFSGLMIALTNSNFRNTYKNIQAPTKRELAQTQAVVTESHYLSEAIITAIDNQLSSRVNNLSKVFNWADQFSFIKNINYSLDDFKDVIQTIEDKIYIPFSNEEKQDILGKAYKIFLSRAGRAEDKNIILTPDHIKKLMVKLARLSVNDVVIDTCMGSGGFLMESMEVMTSLAQDDFEKIEHIRQNQLIGMEIDHVLFALACSNMFLHGDGRSNLLYRNSLLYKEDGNLVNSDDQELMEFIKELAPTKSIINPPYEADSPIHFTLQAIDYIEDNGKLVIIMPTPTLTKHKDDGLTAELLSKAKLDYVIKMPYALFNEQGRTVNTSIFGFTKTPHNVNDEVLFYNLKDDGFESVQHKGRLDVRNRWNDIENQLLDCINNSREIDGVSVKKKIYKQEDDGSYTLIPSGIAIDINLENMVKMKDIFKFDDGLLKKDKLQSTKNDPDGEYDFITASDEWKKHSTYTNDGEALVYAIQAGGSLGKSQYVNGKFIPSNLCLVLTANDDSGLEVNLEFYNIYLNTIREQITDDLADGTSKLTLKEDDLKEYYIEYFPIEIQNRFVEEHVEPYKAKIRELHQMENDLINAMDSIVED